LTIEAAGFCPRGVYPDLAGTCSDLGTDRLRAAGWTPECEMVVLNPAGGFRSRNWPLQNYVEFARLWRSASGRPTQFLVLGLQSMQAKAAFLRAHLGPCLVDLSNQTSPAEAFTLVRRATLIVSEDSGLMHMAWISGVPTVALFGSSRASWSAPQGNYSVCLHSGDLPCGACMEAECRFGDVHCLTRYTPARVVEVALHVVRQSATTRKIIWESPQRSPG
jgi:ADP-heptose:LPS heptosyltransferase